MKKRLFALAAAGALTLSLLAGCGGKKTDPTPAPTPTPTATAPEEKPHMNVAVLNGPTGMGAAKLMADAEAGKTAVDYTFTVFTDNTQVAAALTNGEVDAAALATNMASNLYHKSEGGIQLAAINTLGVLKILQGGAGEAVVSLRDLEGQTVYATGQGANPEYVLNYLLTENGLDPATEVNLQWMTPEEVTQGLLSGKAEFAMLPVPAANVAQLKSKGAVKIALDLTEEWNSVTDEGRLTMGCMVVRTPFAKENAETVRAFLGEYEASIAYMTDPGSLAVSSDLNPAKLLETYALAPAAVAADALADANLTFIAGAEDLRDAIQGYYQVLFAANPASIGGGIPDDAFYFE